MIEKIGKSLENFNRRLRPFLSPAHRRGFDKMLERGLKQHQSGEPIVVCDFANPAIDAVGGRYYASLVLDFIAAGYFPVFIAHRQTVASFVMSFKKSLILSHRLGVVRSISDLTEPFYLITDRAWPQPPALARKVIRADYQWRVSRKPDEIELPFFIHPAVAMASELPCAYELEAKRKARLFFGGNTTEKRYSKDVIGETYGMLTRHAMLTVAQETCGDATLRPTSTEEWLDADAFREFVMFETNRCKIPKSRWLEALTQAEFFLACPGVSMPLCHNLIEAIAAGAIPILQYSRYLSPPLQDGVNCLTFDGEKSLAAVISRVLAMAPEEIHTLRRGVQAYYQEHLAPGQFTKHLLEKSTEPATLLINAYRVPR